MPGEPEPTVTPERLTGSELEVLPAAIEWSMETPR
jgi:hypothetical protein